jgi:hypothetical protein
VKNARYLVPVILLGSGIICTVVGLAFIVARGVNAPIAALVFLLVGLIDGISGSAWAVAMLFSRRPDGRPGPEATARDEARQRCVLAGGLLSVIFLGAILAVLLYLHVIVGCLRSRHLL